MSDKRWKEMEHLRVVFKSALLRAGNKCERCGELSRFWKRMPLHGHHIWTRGRGGPHEFWNLAVLCGGCHAAIHAYTEEDSFRWLARDEAGARAIRERLDG